MIIHDEAFIEAERRWMAEEIARARAEYDGRLKHLQPKLIQWRDEGRRSFATIIKWAGLDPEEDYDEVANALGVSPDHDPLIPNDELPSVRRPDWDFTRPEGDPLRTMSPLRQKLLVELAREFVPEKVRQLEQWETLGTLWKP